MRCDGCARWITGRNTVYDDGSTVDNFNAPDGKGFCEKLLIETVPDFGCTAFSEGTAHIVVSRKVGAPWQHWTMGPCPDCGGKGNAGDSGCHRCTGTGKVRHYDDGHVGEERTRMHPKERAAGPVAKPKCGLCGHEVEPAWVACPTCGTRREAPAETQVIGEAESMNIRS